MDVPLISVPSDMRGVRLIIELGGAYEHEEEYACSWLIRQAEELTTALRDSGLDKDPDVSKFLAELNLAIDFLEPVSHESVLLYSYERAPSIDDLLAAFADGCGADDWALEKLARKGDEGRTALLSVLRKQKNADKLLSAISMLLIVFRDDQTIAAIEQFVEDSGDEIGRAAAMLVSAYTTN